MDNEILVYAFKYAFGRMTNAPSVVARNIRALMPSMTRAEKMIWIGRIKDAAQDQPIGWDCDYDTWAGLYQELLHSVGVKNPQPLNPDKRTKTTSINP